jgi:hypothetical protein
MTIASSITGASVNGDAAQVFNLLSVVANPDAYAEKLKALVESTEENKKILALVGPASEILKIREEIEEDKADAKAIVTDAKKKAVDIISKAEKSAATAQKAAKEKSDALLAQAEDVQSKATLGLSDADALKASLEAERQALAFAKSEAESEKQRYAALSKELENERISFLQMKKVLQDKVAAFASDIA